MTLTRITSLAVLAASLSCNAGLILSDTIGDQQVYTGITALDIAGVDVSNTGSDLTFKILLNGDPARVSGPGFIIAINSLQNRGATYSGPGERPILLPGMDYFLESDGVTSKLSSWNYGIWSRQETDPTTEKDASSFTMTVRSEKLGLTLGSTFQFDIYTSFSGAQYGAFDSLSDPNRTILDPSGYYASRDYFSSYTMAEVTPVPEPAHYGLICAGGLLGIVTFQNWRKRKTA